MSNEIKGFVDGTRKAAASLTAKQYTAVKLATSGKVAAFANAADRPYGILQNDPEINQPAEVLCSGICPAIAGEAIAEGVRFGLDASGRVVATSTGNDWGFTLEAATAAGDRITVQVGCM